MCLLDKEEYKDAVIFCIDVGSRCGRGAQAVLTCQTQCVPYDQEYCSVEIKVQSSLESEERKKRKLLIGCDDCR